MLEALEKNHASDSRGQRRVSVAPDRGPRRDLSEDFAEDPQWNDPHWEDENPMQRRNAPLRLRFPGIPSTKRGRVVAGSGLVLGLGLCVGLFLMARSFLLHDERFVIPSSSSIELQGNAHISRAQLLSVFGEDVERNIFTVSLTQRRAELERLPWVAHATVMRLLPNRMRVSIVERAPVAFVRQGNHIGLVDSSGVLLDMPTETKPDGPYSFPVVTGISVDEPLSTRAARMKIFERFMAELDGSGEQISHGLSEVDLSNPEDVKALIPDHSTEVLVHFGDSDFLDRYRRFEEHLPEWRTVYPKLSSVDMRYERQVVLEMQPGSGVPAAASNGAATAMAAESSASATPGQVANTNSAKAAAKPRTALHPLVVKHLRAVKVKASVKASRHANAKKVGSKAKKHVVVAKPHAVLVKPTDSPQVVHP